MPTTREEFWRAKFDANTERDRRNRRDLLKAGWRVAIVWECALRQRVERDIALRIDQWLHGSDREFDTSLSGAADSANHAAGALES